MACVETMAPVDVDSEREEGEIVDELDELSDISSEEEYLLRQRLQVLETYNNVLERKEAKRASSIGPGFKKYKAASRNNGHFSNFEPPVLTEKDTHFTKKIAQQKHYTKHKKPVLLQEETLTRHKDKKKKPYKQKKKLEPKVVHESSDESDFEYRNKRRKLANAVSVTKNKTDSSSSLKARLMQMMCGVQPHTVPEYKEVVQTSDIPKPIESEVQQSKDNEVEPKLNLSDENNCFNLDSKTITDENNCFNLDSKTITDLPGEPIDLCSDSESVQIINSNDETKHDSGDVVDGVLLDAVVNKKQDEASDEDLELLRQHALKSKSSKTVETNNVLPEPVNSDDEDSDTAELRLICLRSALLKKAIEMKQKQKLRKKLSHSTSLYDDVISNDVELAEKKSADNNTDIESVDMDIGSDHEDKDNVTSKNSKNISVNCIPIEKCLPKEDDIEEDEDLLRAKLLTSLSKNLAPLFSNSNSIEKTQEPVKKIPAKKISVKNTKKPAPAPKPKPEKPKEVEDKSIPDEKRFIIHTGDSDSEGEHEATKNLTKMHQKLSEQPDFQLKLDLFLKSARMEVERTQEPDAEEQPAVLPLPEPPQKFVPKALNHLPKSEMIEYKNLVKRMAELEKIKQIRQANVNSWTNEQKTGPFMKETLKPRNVSVESATPLTQNVLDERIAISRKKIAEESAKVLKLKEEHTSLTQKYKIVATELRNISTAIALNKKRQKASHIQLSRTRAQHQLLLKRSTTNVKHGGTNIVINNRTTNKINATSKVQKENDPLKGEYLDANELKTVRVSIVNDFKDTVKPPPPAPAVEERLSVQVDMSSNKKTVRIPKLSSLSRQAHLKLDESKTTEPDGSNPPVSDPGGSAPSEDGASNVNDYKSPLAALSSSGGPDALRVLCPFDVAGRCQDRACRYLHLAPTH
ncbi:hypothetical protein JYU34_009323 [Plutella xylostella]|uniref:Putative zinc-finger domain-containing protein n=1 Tax=Plutella xylostella TaxID=51655 RepID=A0ABQ7QKG7_PLUXY|nr:hypothetical protein JYU34_009323 [Plutella xylostella]